MRNSNFGAFIDVFTPNTYIMVISSDSQVRPEESTSRCDKIRNSGPCGKSSDQLGRAGYINQYSRHYCLNRVLTFREYTYAKATLCVSSQVTPLFLRLFITVLTVCKNLFLFLPFWVPVSSVPSVVVVATPPSCSDVVNCASILARSENMRVD